MQEFLHLQEYRRRSKKLPQFRINPCAFVTIIFLISYLSVLKYNKNAIFWVGATFSLAVFLSYFFIGIGFLKFVSMFRELSFLKEILFYLTIFLALLMGILSLRDFVKIKKGSLKDMDMKLTDNIRKKINTIIRNNIKLKHYIFAAFLIGVIISILELTCTGQVYLPTTLFIINTRGMELKAIMLLLEYNLAFIAPLIIIFFLYWRGMTNEKILRNWLDKHGASIKLSMGVIFIGLAAILLYIK